MTKPLTRDAARGGVGKLAVRTPYGDGILMRFEQRPAGVGGVMLATDDRVTVALNAGDEVRLPLSRAQSLVRCEHEDVRLSQDGLVVCRDCEAEFVSVTALRTLLAGMAAAAQSMGYRRAVRELQEHFSKGDDDA